ncbi:porin [Catenovulum adriaticum]|uniref:OprO/OprP family phosphate-selective porin n=1 Tax=Catenovulum adriaticum TaxID=2984846 RepID=A0ABY7AKT5_9ALTE|nr:porin [Catenovulum sp. TS8]WAJ70139.1 OprO/OprP family phosphate-selective porin [Catenovulum sp. TS8]
MKNTQGYTGISCGRLLKLSACSGALLLMTSNQLMASPSLSGGLWFNYRYVNDGGDASVERDQDTMGDIADEALIFYVDDVAENRPWSLSAELRVGPGSFTDPSSNSSGDNVALHKAWINYKIDEQNQLYLGKSQVPFGWKTVNFWPGDMLQGGYGDQMDVGIKYKASRQNLTYNLAYYHADDWGESSTDSLDDNGHWGSASGYRKIQTLVADASYQLNSNHKLGASFQTGKLQDLSEPNLASDQNPAPVDGKHNALALYYIATFNPLYVKTQWIKVNRELPDNYRLVNNLATDIENDRAAIEIGYKHNNWFAYINANWAKTNTNGNSADSVTAFAPGVSYNYGPGWFYLEYLTQNGYIDANGDVGEGDFSAFYASVDYYF